METPPAQIPTFQPVASHVHRRPLNEFVVIDSNSDRPKNFVIGNCLKCQALVKVSALADPESMVKCPRCSEKFKLYTVLDQFVPELELVEEEPEQDENVPHADLTREFGDNSDKPRTKFVVPKQLAAGARKRRKGRRRKSSSSSNGSSGSNGSSSRSTSNHRSSKGASELVMVDDSPTSSREHNSESSRSGSSRSKSSSSKKSSKSKSPSSSAETLKLVVGGMLALPLAYAILFWGFNRDPLNVAPLIHGVVPAVVPEVLIPETESPNAQQEGLDDESEKLPVPDLDPDDVRANPDLGF